MADKASELRDELVMAVACAILRSEGKDPNELRVFFDPFNWEGELRTPPGAHDADAIMNKRPAWTAPRPIKTARQVIEAYETAKDNLRRLAGMEPI